MTCRLLRSAIAARLVHLREIDRTAFWEFCNKIYQYRNYRMRRCGVNDPIFRAAVPQCAGSALQLFPSDGVTIRSQGTKAPVKTLESRDRRSPLTTWRMSRIAKGSYCRARCSQKQALAQIAKSGGLRFRSELPAVLARRESCGGGRQCWRFLTRTRLRYAQPH
jgi:hypothetical protein